MPGEFEKLHFSLDVLKQQGSPEVPHINNTVNRDWRLELYLTAFLAQHYEAVYLLSVAAMTN